MKRNDNLVWYNKSLNATEFGVLIDSLHPQFVLQEIFVEYVAINSTETISCKQYSINTVPTHIIHTLHNSQVEESCIIQNCNGQIF